MQTVGDIRKMLEAYKDTDIVNFGHRYNYVLDVRPAEVQEVAPETPETPPAEPVPAEPTPEPAPEVKPE